MIVVQAPADGTNYSGQKNTFICRCAGIADQMHSGGANRLRPRSNSEVDLLRYRQRIIDLNAEIPNGALNLGVAEQ